MIEKRLGVFGFVSEVKKHEYAFVFRKAESSGEFFRVEEIDPASVEARVCCGKHQVRCHDARILNTGVVLIPRIGEYVITIVSYNEHRARAITAWCFYIDNSSLQLLRHNKIT